MENLILRKESVENALKMFKRELDAFEILPPKESLEDPVYERTRNSVIHSFEFSIEALWKYLKFFLYDLRKVNTENAHGPRAIFHLAHKDGILSIEELKQCLDAVADRNRTSHTYLEALAESIARNSHQHYIIMKIITDRLGEYA